LYNQAFLRRSEFAGCENLLSIPLPLSNKIWYKMILIKALGTASVLMRHANEQNEEYTADDKHSLHKTEGFLGGPKPSKIRENSLK
jgi:hypothetical protein